MQDVSIHTSCLAKLHWCLADGATVCIDTAVGRANFVVNDYENTICHKHLGVNLPDSSFRTSIWMGKHW